MTQHDDGDIDLIPMPHTYRCGAFDCGDVAINAALRDELPNAIYHGYLRAFYVQGNGRCQAFVALRVRSFQMDNEDRAARIRGTGTEKNLGAIHIELIAVDLREQRQGLGEKILSFCTALALQVSASVGVRFLTLESRQDPDLIRLYENAGFTRNIPEVGTAADGTVAMFLDLEET